MKTNRIIPAMLTGLVLAAAGALTAASAGPAGEGRIGADPGLEIRVVPVEDIGRVSPQLVRRPLPAHAPRVTLWTSAGTGGIVYPGQDMTVRFSVNRDAYVVVYDIDTRGVARLLYPERPGDDGFVRGGRTRRLPGPHAGYRLMVTGPPGVERIVALASDRPLVHRWREFADADLADAGLLLDGTMPRVGVLQAGLRVVDEDAGFAAAVRIGTSEDSAPNLVRRRVRPDLVPVPRGGAAVSRDETWFRVGRQWRW